MSPVGFHKPRTTRNEARKTFTPSTAFVMIISIKGWRISLLTKPFRRLLSQLHTQSALEASKLHLAWKHNERSIINKIIKSDHIALAIGLEEIYQSSKLFIWKQVIYRTTGHNYTTSSKATRACPWQCSITDIFYQLKWSAWKSIVNGFETLPT